jgi:hypothetical protein
LTADVADRHRQYFAVALLGVGLINLMRALETITPPSAASLFDYALIALGVITIGSLLPSVVAKFRLSRGEKIAYFSEDGYVAQLLRRSFRVSWATTFLSLIALEWVARDLPTELPGAFFIQIGLFIMPASMSITFLLLNWSTNRDLAGSE